MKTVRKTLIIAVLLLALMVGALAADVEISSFDTTVTVNLDNSYTVSQNIVASFAVSGAKLTRTVPRIAPSGRTMNVGRVSCNMRIRKSKTAQSLVMKLGKGSSPGLTEAYSLSYTCKVGYDFDEEKDVLHINLADTNMGAKADSFTFTVTLPAPFQHKSLKFISGYYGELGEDKISYTISGNVISGYLTGGLMAFESLNMELELENGYFAGAVYKNAVGDFLQKTLPYVSLFLCIAAMFILMTRCKNQAVEIEPSGTVSGRLNPPEMLFVIGGSVSPQQMTSLIPYWGEAGYLSFVKEDKETALVRLSDPNPDWPEYERQLFDAIFAEGDRIILRRQRRELIAAVNQARRGLAARWSEGKNALFKPQKEIYPRLVMLLPLAACAFTSVACGNSIYRARLSIILVILLFALLGAGLWAAMLGSGWVAKKQGSRVNYWGVGLGIAVAVIAAINLYTNDCALLPMAALEVSMLVAFVTGMYMWDMTPRTRLGLSLLRESLQLRDFLRYATDRQVRDAGGEQPDLYYYSLLSYAGAFGLESVWTGKFTSMRLPVPGWFELNTSGLITPLTFMTRLEERMQRVKRCLTGSDADRALTMVYLRSALRNIGLKIAHGFLEMMEVVALAANRVKNIFSGHKDK